MAQEPACSRAGSCDNRRSRSIPDQPLPKRLARFNLHVTNRVLGPVARQLPGFAVVSHVGRRSGRVYRTPVNLFRDDDRYVIALTYGADSQWVRNVLAAGAVDIETRGRRVHLVAPEVVHDAERSLVPEPVRPILRLARVSDFLLLRARARSATPSQTSVTVEGTTPTQIRAESFPDLGDEVMYPRLSAKKLEWLAELGKRRSFAAGETLYEQGQRDAPFLVIERGRVRVLDRKPGKDVWIAEADAGHVPRRHRDLHRRAGDRRVRRRRADRRDRLRPPGAARDARAWPEMGELILRTLMARREWHEAQRARRAAAHRPARLAARVRGARPARAQPRPGALVRRRHRPRERGDARLAADPARGDAGPRAQHGRCCATRRPPRSPASSACARRSTASASTSSCSAAGRRGSRPPSTAAPRGCARSWPRPGRPAARPAPARGSRTTSASRPGSPAPS